MVEETQSNASRTTDLFSIKTCVIILGSLLLLSLPTPHGCRRTGSPVINQLRAMNDIWMKLAKFHYSYTNRDNHSLSNLFISDYVKRDVLSPQHETYIEDHAIIFHGFMFISELDNMPVLEATQNNRHITIYSDGSGDIRYIE